MKSLCLIFSFCCLFFTVPVFAQGQSAPNLSPSEESELQALFFDNASSFSVREAIRLAIEHNPALKKERSQLQLEKSVLLQNLANYDPLLQYQLFQSRSHKPREFIFQPSKTETLSSELSLLSRFPTGTNLSLKSALIQSEDDSTFTAVNPKSISRVEFAFNQKLLQGAIQMPERLKLHQLELEIQKSELFLRRVTEEIILQVAKAYFNLWLSRHLLELAVSSEKEAKDFLDLTQRLQKNALREEEDLLRAEVSYLLRQSETLKAKSEVQNSWNSLLKVMNVSISSSIIDRLILELDLKIEEPYPEVGLEEAFRKRADYLAQKIALEQSQLSQKQSFAARFPELDLLGSYGFSGLKSSFSESFSQSFSFPSWNVGFTFRYPFGNRKGKGEQELTQSNFLRAKSQLESIRESIREGVFNSLNSLKLSQAQLRLFGDIEAKEKKLLEMMTRKYIQGRVSSLDILQSQENLRQKRLQLILAKKSVVDSYFHYLWQKGTLLDWLEGTKER